MQAKSGSVKTASTGSQKSATGLSTGSPENTILAWF